MSRVFNGSRIVLKDKDTGEEYGVIDAECSTHKGNWYVNLPAKEDPLKKESHGLYYDRSTGEAIVELDRDRAMLALAGAGQ